MTTWIKLHDNFWENPKVLAAGEDAALLYIQGLSYCSRNLTDGAIPTPALRMLTAKRDARTLAHRLVREGLWIETATGWRVHDYLDVQRSREQIEAEREATRQRVAKHRASRAGNAVSTTVGNGQVTQPDTETDTETDTEPPSVPPEVWTEYARQKAENLNVGNFDAWSVPVIAQAKARYGMQAALICARYVASPTQIAYALLTNNCRGLEPYKRKVPA